MSMWNTCQGKETPQRVNEVFPTKFNDGVIPVPPTPPRSTHPPPSPPSTVLANSHSRTKAAKQMKHRKFRCVHHPKARKRCKYQKRAAHIRTKSSCVASIAMPWSAQDCTGLLVDGWTSRGDRQHRETLTEPKSRGLDGSVFDPAIAKSRAFEFQ